MPAVDGEGAGGGEHQLSPPPSQPATAGENLRWFFLSILNDACLQLTVKVLVSRVRCLLRLHSLQQLVSICVRVF